MVAGGRRMTQQRSRQPRRKLRRARRKRTFTKVESKPMHNPRTTGNGMAAECTIGMSSRQFAHETGIASRVTEDPVTGARRVEVERIGVGPKTHTPVTGTIKKTVYPKDLP